MSGTTLAVSVVSLAALLILRRFVPALPGALFVVVAAIAVSWAFDFTSHGIAIVGPIPGGLPHPTLPTPPLDDVLDLVPAALASSSSPSRTRSSLHAPSPASTTSTCARRRSCS